MKRKAIILGVILILCVFVGSTLYSIAKFSVINPISSCLGMLQILFTDTPYTVVQNHPKKVMFSKVNGKAAGNLLDEYMENRGFSRIPEQFGDMLVYSNGGMEEEKIHFSVNAYYSSWKWEE